MRSGEQREVTRGELVEYVKVFPAKAQRCKVKFFAGFAPLRENSVTNTGQSSEALSSREGSEVMNASSSSRQCYCAAVARRGDETLLWRRHGIAGSAEARDVARTWWSVVSARSRCSYISQLKTWKGALHEQATCLLYSG